MNPLIQSWLVQSLVIFLMLGSLAGMAVGLLLVLRPQSLQRLSQILNRWVSTRHLEQPLERSINLDPWLYRYRRSSGALTLLGAGYIIYFFTVSMDRVEAISGLAKHFKLPPALVGGLLDALVLSALLGALFAAFISLFLLLRPSLLREFEQGANHWVSLRRTLKPMEIPRAGVDEFIFQHGRRAGILLVLGSLYILALLTFWFGRYWGA